MIEAVEEEYADFSNPTIHTFLVKYCKVSLV